MGCRHEDVKCASIVCHVPQINSREIAHIEIKSIINHSTLQEHYAGTVTYAVCDRLNQVVY